MRFHTLPKLEMRHYIHFPIFYVLHAQLFQIVGSQRAHINAYQFSQFNRCQMVCLCEPSERSVNQKEMQIMWEPGGMKSASIKKGKKIVYVVWTLRKLLSIRGAPGNT